MIEIIYTDTITRLRDQLNCLLHEYELAGRRNRSCATHLYILPMECEYWENHIDIGTQAPLPLNHFIVANTLFRYEPKYTKPAELNKSIATAVQ